MEKLIEKHREFLVDRIEPDFGLLDKLLASMTLTRESVHRIKLKDNTTEDKNRILLDFILKNKKANEFISALMDSGQSHLVNYLSAGRGYGLAFGDDWPLSESNLRKLDINRESLIDLLDTSDLCNRLYSEKVINNRQKQLIFSKPTDADKNEALLDMMTRFSLRQYKKTIVCLHDSNQSHLADLFSEEGGVLVRVHANLEAGDGNVDALEDEIITQFKRVLERRPLGEAIRLLDETKLGIIAVKKGNSIVTYIHCKTHDELLQLTDFLKTDKLKEIVERVFIEMLTIGDVLTVSLTWSSEEFKRASMYFDTGDASVSRDLQFRLEVTERSPLSPSASAMDSREEGWIRDGSNRQTPLGKLCGCDASTQTDEETYCTSGDDYFCLRRKLQQTQEENDKLKKLLGHQTKTESSDDSELDSSPYCMLKL